MAKGEGGESSAFSLFSAINGLIERACSSAEKESQRLFRSPTAPPRAKSSSSNSNNSSNSNSNSSNSSNSNSNSKGRIGINHRIHRQPLAGSFAMAKQRPRPVRTLETKAPTTQTRRSGRQPVAAGRENAEEKRIAAEMYRPSTPQSTAKGSAMGMAAKRKREEEKDEVANDAPVDAARVSSPKKMAIRVLENGAGDGNTPESLATKSRPSRSRTASPMARESQLPQRGLTTNPTMPPPPAPPPPPTLPPPPPQLKRPTTAQTSASDHLPSKSGRHAARTRSAHRVVPRRSSLGSKSADGSASVPTTPDSAALVEQARLEKVERELHRLKKIIASLLPNELNEDDLRSVYGDLEQPALASDDLVARLVRSRLGSQLTSGYSIQTPHSQLYPPSPHSSSPAQVFAPPLPPVLSVPYPQIGLPTSGREQHSAPDRRQRDDGHLRVHSPTVKRLRAELRPVDQRPVPSQPAPSSQPKPPPHKDPSVMAKLLEEMKHHKLRPTRKPKDMRGSTR
ncbi:hypothetical protein GQ54DRAFT_295034 [Martensiomyces pterosporus]|nr:hypothetical protein GQ54DRAFT_295034 [Martensiomyces pterosporus]